MMSTVKSSRRALSLVGLLLIISIVMAVAWSRVEAATPTLSAQSATAGVGQTVSVPIVLSEAPAGVAGYVFTVNLSNPGVATIDAVSIPDLGLTNLVQNSSSEVEIAAVDLNALIESGATNTALATLTLQAVKKGSTDIQIGVTTLDDDDGFPIGATVLTGSLSVKKGGGGKGGGKGGGDNDGGGKGGGNGGGKGGGKGKNK